MSTVNIQTLPIESDLQLRLSELLEQFQSYRIHNNLDAVSKEEEIVETPKKKRKISFLEKLFITEYDE